MTVGQELSNVLGSLSGDASPPSTSEDSIQARFVAFGKAHNYQASPSSSVDEFVVPAEIMDVSPPWSGYTITITGIYGKERVQS